jgi:serine/threonine protein kinase
MKGRGLTTVKKDVRQWVVKRTKSGALADVKQSVAEAEEKRGNGGNINDLSNLSISADEVNTKSATDRMNPSGVGAESSPPPKVTFSVKGTQFRVDTRYNFIKVLGLGAYGVVCSASDSKSSTDVAIKKVAGVFDDQTDAKRIIREIRLLSLMKHDNILSIIDIDEPEVYTQFNDVYLVTELMDTDLNKLLRSKHPLLDTQRKFFTYQLFRALKYIHSANILHRDLKPANVLVSENVSPLHSAAYGDAHILCVQDIRFLTLC